MEKLEGDFIDVGQLASYLGVKVKSIYNLHSKGLLPPFDLVLHHKYKRWKRETLERFLEHAKPAARETEKAG